MAFKLKGKLQISDSNESSDECDGRRASSPTSNWTSQYDELYVYSRFEHIMVPYIVQCLEYEFEQENYHSRDLQFSTARRIAKKCFEFYTSDTWQDFFEINHLDESDILFSPNLEIVSRGTPTPFKPIVITSVNTVSQMKISNLFQMVISYQ